MSDFERGARPYRHNLSRITGECHGNLSVKNGRRQMFLLFRLAAYIAKRLCRDVPKNPHLSDVSSNVKVI